MKLDVHYTVLSNFTPFKIFVIKYLGHFDYK